MYNIEGLRVDDEVCRQLLDPSPQAKRRRKRSGEPELSNAERRWLHAKHVEIQQLLNLLGGA